MKDGKQGASAYNDSINAAANAVEAFASKFGFLGKMLGTLLTAGARYTAEVNKQSDALFDAYKNLSQSGLSDAGGMRTIFDNMQKFGYGIEQLGEMTALLKANSKELAAFGGTAASGTKAFADAAGEIQRSDVGKSLQMLGKTPDEINKGMALFVKQQQQSGMSSAAINQNLAQKSAEYVKQLDVLSKLTGDDAEKLQEKLNAAMAEDAFNQTVYELRKKEAAGDREAGRLATEYENTARRLTGEALKEFQQGVGGDISAMPKTLMAAADAVSLIGTSAFTTSGYIDKVAKGVTQQRDTQGELFKLNAGRDFMFAAKEMSEIQSRYATDTAASQEDRAKAEQELQQKGLEPATKAQVELRIEQMKTRDSLQSLINKGINPVTTAMQKLAGATETVVGLAPGTTPATGSPIGGAGGNTSQILETIKKRESGGNYNAQNPYSSASGAYQFIDSTWQGLTKKYGIGSEFKSAKMAPKDIQDAVAKKYVDEILKQAGGDVSKVPLAWYTGNIQGNLGGAKIAPGHPGVSEYQSKWMNDYNKMSGMAGPNGGYQSKTSGLNPSASLPTASSSNAPATTNAETDMPAWLASLNESLERQNRLQGEAVDALGRIRQNTAV
jgi:biopolymer transport protein ExbB/TolQ